MAESLKLEFPNEEGHVLTARLELPDEEPQAFAIFAHCFACSKDLVAVSRISRALTQAHIAVLRFDFTGLGSSGGDFANTNFSSNISDIVYAAKFLREKYQAPKLLIGQSFGGIATLAAAQEVPEVKAVASIAAPSDPAHVSHLFNEQMETIEKNGEATVHLAGREFNIKKQFIDDIKSHHLPESLKDLNKALIVFHSPLDETVSIDHARKIFESARHPKSFVSIDKGDHLLTRKEDAEFVATVLGAWASRYVKY